MSMYNPPHPGEIIRDFCVEAIGVNSYGCSKCPGSEHRNVFKIAQRTVGNQPGNGAAFIESIWSHSRRLAQTPVSI